MARKKKPKEEGTTDLNMSAMIDVVFLLLIYFVVTQKPIVEDIHLPSDLPSPNSKPPPVKDIPKPPFKIVVKDGEKYLLDGILISLDDIQKRLITLERDVTIMIQCSPNAYHSKLIRLLDLLTSQNFTKINIIDDGGADPFKK